MKTLKLILVGVCMDMLASGEALGSDVDLSYSELRPLPNYPRQAAIDCIEGEVLASFTVSQNHGVEDVEIVRAQPEGVFNQVVLDVLERWTIEAPPGTELEKLFIFDLGCD